MHSTSTHKPSPVKARLRSTVCALLITAAALPVAAPAATAAVSVQTETAPQPSADSLPPTPRPDPALKPPAGPDASAASQRSDPYAAQVFDLMNARRRAAGVAPLQWNQTIADGSQGWANRLLVATADPDFDWGGIHRPDAGRSIIPAGATWYSEIIAFNFSAQSIVDWWMNSPAHKAAMLDPRETHAGVGFVVPTSGPYAGWHLVVSNLAAYPAAAAPAPAPAPAAKPVSPFRDVTGDQQFLHEINWLHSRGISTGWTEADGSRTYRPLDAVNRDAMAAFMYRLEGSPAFTPPAVSPFTDVAVTDRYYKEISWLAARKVSTGWAGPNGTAQFRPLESVSREAMAAFLYRLAGSPGRGVPAEPTFTDVPADSKFRREIAWLAATGISTGWTAPDGSAAYRSEQAVARDAMAAFMKRWDTL